MWRHSTLTRQRQTIIYNALIESKLLYAMSSLCLTAAQERKLNAFQNWCLRRIYKIQPSYYSRAPNAEVLRQSGKQAVTGILADRQLGLFDRILAAPEGHPLRTASFIPESNRPATDLYIRRRGRPSKEYVLEMLARKGMSRYG